MRSVNKILIPMLFISLFLVGCRTGRTTVETKTVDMESLAVFSSSPSVVQPRTALSGNLKMSANVNGLCLYCGSACSTTNQKQRDEQHWCKYLIYVSHRCNIYVSLFF